MFISWDLNHCYYSKCYLYIEVKSLLLLLRLLVTATATVIGYRLSAIGYWLSATATATASVSGCHSVYTPWSLLDVVPHAYALRSLCCEVCEREQDARRLVWMLRHDFD